MAAVIVQSRGPVSFDIELADRQIVDYHVDHVRTRTVPADPSKSDESLLPLPLPQLPSETPALAVPPLSAQNPCSADHFVRRLPDCYTELAIWLPITGKKCSILFDLKAVGSPTFAFAWYIISICVSVCMIIFSDCTS